MEYSEARSFLFYQQRRRRFVKDLAEALGLDPERTVSRNVLAVYRYLQDNKPSEPAGGVLCDGCGGVGSGKGLRWAKVANGEPVTVSMDIANRPESLAHVDLDYVIKKWCKPWDKVCGITHVPVTDSKGDIHIGYKALSGSTLGFAWQPAGDAEFMEQGGDLSGDLFIDADRSWSRRTADGTGCHEIGHADGHAHINDRRALMYPYSNGFTTPQKADIEAALIKYPK